MSKLFGNLGGGAFNNAWKYLKINYGIQKLFYQINSSFNSIFQEHEVLFQIHTTLLIKEALTKFKNQKQAKCPRVQKLPTTYGRMKCRLQSDWDNVTAFKRLKKAAVTLTPTLYLRAYVFRKVIMAG